MQTERSFKQQAISIGKMPYAVVPNAIIRLFPTRERYIKAIEHCHFYSGSAWKIFSTDVSVIVTLKIHMSNCPLTLSSICAVMVHSMHWGVIWSREQWGLPPGPIGRISCTICTTLFIRGISVLVLIYHCCYHTSTRLHLFPGKLHDEAELCWQPRSRREWGYRELESKISTFLSLAAAWILSQGQ